MWKLRLLKVLLLSVLVGSAYPIKPVSAVEYRWYAGIKLVGIESDYIDAISAKLEVIDNYIEAGFVAFWIGILQVYETIFKPEWVAVGYYQNEKGDYILYVDWWYQGNYYYIDFKYTYVGALHLVEIINSGISEWTVTMDGEVVVTVQLTIWTHSLYVRAVAESPTIYNSLNGHFSDLSYYQQGTKYLWKDISVFNDYPYTVSLISTFEFYTNGMKERPAGWKRGGGQVWRGIYLK